MRSISVILAIAVVFLCYGVLVFASNSHPDASIVLRDMEQYGNKSFIHKLYSDAELFRYFISNVEKASDDWIRIAARLFHNSDASLYSELSSALSIALSKRPTIVLSAMNEPSEVNAVCSAPFLIDYPDRASGLKTLEATKHALQQVRSGELEARKTICLTAIQVQIDKMTSFPSAPNY